MVVKTTAKPLCNSASPCLLSLLFLACCFSMCWANLARRVKIRTNDSTTRPEATIPQGRMQGINMLTHHNRTVFGFIGIPYAQAPVGDLRFRAPVSADSWNGTLDAGREREPCPQLDDQDRVVGNEDCLHLNAFTPQLPANGNATLLPVMVFINGGGFRTEDNTLVRYAPDLLLDEDVVLVVPNFRVGILGYLTTGDEVSPGNYGLKDVVRALQWVQESIQYLGGDPNCVTLFGGSSGGVSVHLLALSNLTNGLIHKYITQSGTALSDLANQPREACVNRAMKYAEYVGCPTNTSTLLINCLRGLNVSQLVDNESWFHVWRKLPSNIWLPTTEPDIEGALLIDSPANLLASGKIRDLPWIASVTRDEGLNAVTMVFYEDPDAFEDLLDNIDVVLPLLLGLVNGADVDTAYMNTLNSYYLNDLSADRSILLANLSHLIGEGLFLYPTYKAVQLQLAVAQSPQYFCSFEYRGVFSYSYAYTGGSTRFTEVVHGDELMYLFETQDYRFGPPDYEKSDSDWIMVDTMVQLWTSFAINGTPTTRDSISTTIWEPYTSLNNYLRIGNGSDTTLEMEYDLRIDRIRFWENLTASTATSGEFRRPLQVMSTILSTPCLSMYAITHPLEYLYK